MIGSSRTNPQFNVSFVRLGQVVARGTGLIQAVRTNMKLDCM